MKYFGNRRLPKWVNRVTLTVGLPLPVYPDQRTFLVFVGASQRCQIQILMINSGGAQSPHRHWA
jgi:hypothetical protein